MSSIYLLYLLVGKFNIAFVTSIVALSIVVAISAVMCGAKMDGNSKFRNQEEIDTYNSSRKKLRRRAKQALLICFVLIPIAIFSPSKEEVVTYIVLNQVDEYNRNNKASTLDAQNALRLIDHTVLGVEKVFINIVKASDSAAQLGIEKIDEQRRKIRTK